jgi:hypothetical protein
MEKKNYGKSEVDKTIRIKITTEKKLMEGKKVK